VQTIADVAIFTGLKRAGVKLKAPMTTDAPYSQSTPSNRAGTAGVVAELNYAPVELKTSAEELAMAAALVASHDEALARGQSAVTDEQRRMVDEAIVRRAGQVLTGQPHENARTK
jgi:hypothetical protein